MSKVHTALILALFVACASALTKSVILSSLKILDDQTTFGDATVKFHCQYAPSGVVPTSIDAPIQGTPITAEQVTNTGFYYVVEVILFQWDNTTSNYIACEAYVDKTIGSDKSLGISYLIPFDDITAEGNFFSGVNPHLSDYYMRCGNCDPPVVTNGSLVKSIGILNMQVSDTLKNIFIEDNDIRVECINAGDPRVYTIIDEDVKKSKKEYRVNRKFTGWDWNVAPGKSTQRATCAIYNPSKISGLQGLGTVIINWNAISPNATRVYWPDDTGTYVDFFQCTDGTCNSGSLIKYSASLFVAMIAFLMF